MYGDNKTISVESPDEAVAQFRQHVRLELLNFSERWSDRFFENVMSMNPIRLKLTQDETDLSVVHWSSSPHQKKLGRCL